jgi:hypothetical protein
VQGDVEVKNSVISAHRFRISRCRCLQGAAVSDRRLPESAAWISRDQIKRIAENYRRAASSISQWRSLHMTKQTQKALAIIIASLGVLVILLFWANHLRPHP